MNNLSKAKKTFKKIRDGKRSKMLFIAIVGCPETMEDLEAVGVSDLRDYFIPQGLKLRKKDIVAVVFKK